MLKPLAAALMLGATALPALAFDPAAMSDAERAAFGQAVRDYLMENPEVLVEAITVLEQRRMAEEADNDLALVAANHEAIFADGHSWVGGNPEGSLTLVEFVDYRCGVCRNVYEQVEGIVAGDGDIRFILKEFPILGQESDMAARFAVAVQQIAGDDIYKQAHDELMVMRQRVNAESLGALADKLGVDKEAVFNRMNTEEVTAVLRANHQLAERMGVMGTPTFVIGDEMLRGVPREGLEAVIADIRAGKAAPEGEGAESVPAQPKG